MRWSIKVLFPLKAVILYFPLVMIFIVTGSGKSCWLRTGIGTRIVLKPGLGSSSCWLYPPLPRIL